MHRLRVTQQLNYVRNEAGTDYDADMKAIADDPETQKWWKVRKHLQQ